MNKRKILIVDDAEINRLLLSDMLSDEFDIIEAENGKIAAEILNNRINSISIMLLDVVMPELDGFELLDMMNKNGWIKEVPVLMISSETNDHFIDKAYDLGALDYISRPFNERIVKRRVNSTITLVTKQKELGKMLAKQLYEKEKDNRLMIEILSNIVEFRNGESGLHILHVNTFTKMLLNALVKRTDKYHIKQGDISIITTASALHDIGKIAVPSEILNKPGKFTEEEFSIMKTHSAEGANMLKNSTMSTNEPLIQYGYQICRWHHERYDGKGYPDGLKGDEIPISAQVVSLADVYDALTSKRVYKDAYSHEKAIEMILNGECGTFNPILLECLNDIKDALKNEINIITPKILSENDLMDTVKLAFENNMLKLEDNSLENLINIQNSNCELDSLSNEIRFRYSFSPVEKFTLSEWGANYLGLPTSFENPREIISKTNLISEEDLNDFIYAMTEKTSSESLFDDRFKLYVNGNRRWCRIIAKSIWEKTDNTDELKFTGIIGKIVDMSDIMREIKHFKRMATRDSLTGLLNRETAQKRINQLLSKNPDKKYLITVIDLDNFKVINDSRGHLFGDEVLKNISKKISETIGQDDLAARVGGDEFIIFTENKNNAKQRIIDMYNAINFSYCGLEIKSSMGIASTSESVNNYDTLFTLADNEMYLVKFNGKNNLRFSEKTV